MTREEAIEKLKKEWGPEFGPGRGDVELQHMEADSILCELLTSLGYHDVVEAWEKVPKWYA